MNPGLNQEDNMAYIWYSEHPGSYEKAKLITRKYQFVQQHVTDRTVKLKFCPSAETLVSHCRWANLGSLEQSLCACWVVVLGICD